MARLQDVPALGEADQARALAQAGAVSFADLAWSHYVWERERAVGAVSSETQAAYVTKLRTFQAEQGRIVRSYWSTEAASAVAMTEVELPPRWDPLRLQEQDVDIRLHRASDWLVHEAELADLLQECDQLATRVRAVLRGTSERIAVGRIYGVMEHVIGCVERAQGAPTPEEVRRLVRSQREQLAEIEDFYLRAGSSAARVVYFGGMLLGALVVLAVGLVTAGLVWAAGLFDTGAAREIGLLFMAFAAGSVGSLVSVMSRLRPGGRFEVDFEVGRRLVRRLGLFRPAVGAIFGVLVYALLQSGILLIDPDEGLPGEPVYYFAVAAFLAGFSERFTHVVIGKAERTIAPPEKDANDR